MCGKSRCVERKISDILVALSMNSENPRAVSARVLEAILGKGAYGSIALSDELDKRPALDKSGRAFVTETVNGVLRNKMLIDHIIAQFSNVPSAKIKPAVMNILRLSVYEIFFMSTADYAVCSEAVKTTKARGFGGLSGFVNGVLRNIMRNKDSISLPNEKTEPAAYLSVAFSHPEWLVKRWIERYGYGFTKDMLTVNNEPPGVSVCVNTLRISCDKLIDILAREGIAAEKPKYGKNALILNNPGSIARLDCYRKGYFHVQDVASQIAVEALAPEKGETVVDLCAAPGGKSFYCAYLMENTGAILASDIHSHKTRILTDGAKRLGISILETETRNAEQFDERLSGIADRVLIDAPCSGLGVIRKKPDIKLNRSEADIDALRGLQRSILSVGARYVKKGGFLLYSTCTLTEEENEGNVSWFLENFDFSEADISERLPETLHSDTKGGSLTLFPHIHDTDGFFMCKFIKR